MTITPNLETPVWYYKTEKGKLAAKATSTTLLYDKILLDEIDVLEANAFYQCNNLQSIIFPATLFKYQGPICKNCEKLELIDLSKTSIKSIDTPIYDGYGQNADNLIIKLPVVLEHINSELGTNIDWIVIPPNVTTISDDVLDPFYYIKIHINLKKLVTKLLSKSIKFQADAFFIDYYTDEDIENNTWDVINNENLQAIITEKKKKLNDYDATDKLHKLVTPPQIPTENTAKASHFSLDLDEDDFDYEYDDADQYDGMFDTEDMFNVGDMDDWY